MVVAVATGGSGGAQFTVDPYDQGQTITAAMAALAAGTDQVAGSNVAYQSLFFLGLVLFLLWKGVRLVTVGDTSGDVTVGGFGGVGGVSARLWLAPTATTLKVTLCPSKAD